ncbi:unnamed protein product [Absidia cylindrospora]
MADNWNISSTFFINNKRKSAQNINRNTPPKKNRTTTNPTDGAAPKAFPKEMEVNIPSMVAKTKATSYSIYGTTVNRQRVLFSKPSKNNAGEPTFFFKTEEIFGSNSIRDIAQDEQVTIHVLKNMFPTEFRNWRPHYKNLPKRIQHMAFIPTHMQKHHPTGSLAHSLNHSCPRKVYGASVNDTLLIDQCISYHSVYLFVRHTLEKVLPSEFFGCEHNLNVFFSNVELFIALRKTETLRVADLMQNIRIKDCLWLASKPRSSVATGGISWTDSAKRASLMADAMYWIFNVYIVGLLRACFYITDHADYGNQLFYFRHDDWVTLSRQWLKESLQSEFKLIDTDTAHTLQLGSSSLRLVPKKKGVRLITNMKKAYKVGCTRFGKSKWQMNNNAALKTAQAVLRHDLDRRSGSIGSGVTTIASIVGRIAKYKASIKQAGSLNTGFYFSKMDIARCFNTIDQNKLLSVLRYIFIDDQYLIQTCKTTKQVGGRILSYYKDIACGLDNDHHEMPARNSIIAMDNKSHTYASTKSLLELIEEHVKRNTIIVDTKLYQQKKGIPQGSSISSSLCEIFLGHLESTELYGLRDTTNGILLRYVDDFLYISNEESDVKQFETILAQGFKKFGLDTSDDKSQNNLEDNDVAQELSWCGLNISTSNLDIFNCYAAYSWAGIKNSLSVTTSHYSKTLLNGCRRNIKQQLYWLKKTTNSPEGVYRVIYEAAVLCAAKLILYTSELSKMIRQSVSCELMLGRKIQGRYRNSVHH